MSNYKNYAICVPTYNRKQPLCLKLLEYDENVTLNLFVRTELYETDFYDELKAMNRVNVIDCGPVALGDARQFIMNWCKLRRYKYAVLLDDGVANITSYNPFDKVHDVIEKAINIMETDPLSEKVIGFTLHKRIGFYADGRTIAIDDTTYPDVNYFLSFPAQAVILNVDKAFEYHLTYKDISITGFEDCAFFGDAIKQGLVYCSRKGFRIDGIVPNEKKTGGSHSATEDLEEKYDRQNATCCQYLGNMMCYSLQKRYRSFAKCCLSLVVWDLDYIREVMIDNPIENKAIIDAGFIFDEVRKDDTQCK